VGDVSEAEMRRLLDELSASAKGREWVLMLADLSKARSASPGARKLGAQKKEYHVRGVALFGASPRFRIVANLVITASNLLVKNPDNPFRFFATEAEARAWLDERRRIVNAEP
jgi:hypothetical protein